MILVLGRRLHRNDVFVNIVGGLKLEDPSTDVAVALAIASSFVAGGSLPRRFFCSRTACVCVYRYTCVCVRVPVHVCVWVCTGTRVCMYRYTCVCVCVYRYTCVCVCVCVPVHLFRSRLKKPPP